ncbi:MAG: hypothetical protein IKU38_07290 [Clostridia bacterium]|nr:hypothetical protein [Clostridia bacterium]
MQEICSRLRAALTPPVLGVAAALMLAALALAGGSRADSLESRISRTLSAVDGAGRVSVTIAMRETGISSGIMGTKQAQSVPCGAVAVAQGADDPLVAMTLQEALCALLGLPPSSVSVMTGGK